jgi:hypothetical protein
VSCSAQLVSGHSRQLRQQQQEQWSASRHTMFGATASWHSVAQLAPACVAVGGMCTWVLVWSKSCSALTGNGVQCTLHALLLLYVPAAVVCAHGCTAHCTLLLWGVCSIATRGVAYTLALCTSSLAAECNSASVA